ncbi:phenylacetate--CoA ligase family protein [Euzebya sp.]|uniref:phenylacetate--CoA ligase family protein n=1 Tax=Euzebya sp. TaxID=1971409 RepID=UPI003511B3D5
MMFQPDLETMPVDERRRLQDRRLADLVRRLQRVDTAWWRAKLDGVGEVTGVDDLPSLPFTTKAELRDAYPYGTLTVPIGDCARVHASSGTSGKPTIVAYTAADLRLFAEVNARCIAAAGGRPDDVFHIAYGYGLFTGRLGLHGGAEALGVTVVPASGGNTALQAQLLADLGARGFCCTPSFALRLGETAIEMGLMDDIRAEYAVLGAEPWSNEMRDRIEALWGIDAVDIYGLSEIIGPGVMVESVEGKGAPFIFDDHFLPEIIDPDGTDPVPPGEPGELVITTLTKEAQPMIRYRTGDITRLVDEPSPCGRTFTRLDRISGRADDMLIIRGVNVFPSAIESVLLAEEALAGHYAIVVDRRQVMADLTVHCELASEDHLTATDVIRDRLERRLHSTLRIRVGVDLGSPGTVPRPEGGKAQRVFERTGDDHPLAGG